MYKAIIWDLDGTLLNTLTDLHSAVNAALAECGLPARTVEEVRCFVGNGIPNLIARAVPAGTDEKKEAEVLASFLSYYTEHMNDHTAPYEGILPLLDDLREKGVRMAVVSNKADYATAELTRLHFGDRLDAAVGAREGVPKKPAPDGVFTALDALGVPAAAAVYIGDSEVDVATGKNAGMDVIAVSWGFRDVETLRAAGARMICDTVAELAELLLGK